MNNNNELSILESILNKQSSKTQSFPNAGSTNYFDRYKQIKEYLARDIYPNIGAGTSAEDGGIYTDHSIRHFNEVIRYAGKLLRDDENFIKKNLDPYEIYMTLVAILLHDAGNMSGRKEHEKKTLEIISKMGDIVSSDKFEITNIAKIAGAHGGKVINDVNGQSSKDTIGALQESDNYQGIKYRPKLIAALVRFADEICESRNRTSKNLIESGTLPKKSEIFHEYCYSISSVDVDHIGKTISIKYDILEDRILRKFGKQMDAGIEEVFLIDEIFERLEKMYHEPSYCMRFMSEICKYNKIKAKISIYVKQEDMDPKQTKQITLEETGYPTELVCLKDMHQDWTGQKLYDLLKK